MAEHLCHCDHVTEPFTYEEQFARVGSEFHIVEHIGEDSHRLKCDNFNWEMDPHPTITCIDCLKKEIDELLCRVRGLEEALTGFSHDEGPF